MPKYSNLSPVRPGAWARSLVLALVLCVPVAAQSTEPRPVYDASSWADVMGELRPYWNAFKSEQQAQGVTWNDTGQITSIEGGTLIRATRREGVPQAAVTRIVSLAREAGVLVGQSAAEAAKIRVDEARRAREAGDEESVGGGPLGVGDGEGDGDGGEDGIGDGDGGDGDGGGEGDGDGDGEDGDGDDGDADEDGGDGDGDGEDDGLTDDPGDGTDPIDPDAPGDEDLGSIGDGTDDGTGGGTGGDEPTNDPPNEDIPDLGTDDPDTGGSNTFESYTDLSYGNQHGRQVLDLFVPSAPGPHPVVIFFHGGAFVGGDKSQVTPFMPLVEAGYALASANYKLLNKSAPSDINFLEDAGEIAKAAYDARKAVRWLKDNAADYDLDASRVGAVGASAGGYLSATVGATSDESSIRDEPGGSSTSPAVKAVIDWSGPTDFATFLQHKGQSLPAPIDLVRSTLNSSGAVSPWDFADSGDPPHMIRHGEIDDVIPVQQSTTYAEKLEGAGVTVDLKTLPAVGHSPPKSLYDEEVGLIIDFLDRHLN